MFGAFYEGLSPYMVLPNLTLTDSPGAWTKFASVLFIDQPIGTGFSKLGTHGEIPEDEMTIAAHLYYALQYFFANNEALRDRPVIISGESYGGKYIPSIGHFILQQDILLNKKERASSLRHTRNLPTKFQNGKINSQQRSLLHEPPLFNLAGLAIGNGLTDPQTQVMTHSEVAFAMGLIDSRERVTSLSMQLAISQLISMERWQEAHASRSQLLSYIQKVAGLATLLDVTRSTDYDAEKTVDAFLNTEQVKQALGIDADTTFESCSQQVDKVLGPDVMKSVKYLLPDLLDRYPVLLYQGEHDIQDGPASSLAWMDTLAWKGQEKFNRARRRILREIDVVYEDTDNKEDYSNVTAEENVEEEHHKRRKTSTGGVVAYWKHHSKLTHVVVRGAGHMPPRDVPVTMQWLMERWLRKEVFNTNKKHARSSSSYITVS